jgi:hypothetical protein
LRLRAGTYQTLFVDLEAATLLLGPSPRPAGALPAGKAWISAPLAGSAAGRLLAAQAEGLAPMLPLRELASGARSASSVGVRVIEGVPLHEYRVSVDLTRALSAARRSRSAGIAGAIRQELDASPSGRVPILVWVSGPGYVAKIQSQVPGSGLGTASIWFLSYSRPYTGTLPPGSQVASLASLARSGRSPWRIATGS